MVEITTTRVFNYWAYTVIILASYLTQSEQCRLARTRTEFNPFYELQWSKQSTLVQLYFRISKKIIPDEFVNRFA